MPYYKGGESVFVDVGELVSEVWELLLYVVDLFLSGMKLLLYVLDFFLFMRGGRSFPKTHT
jgi:hypothetical protein